MFSHNFTPTFCSPVSPTHSSDSLAVASTRGPSFAFAHCPDTVLINYMDLCSESIQCRLGLRMETRAQPHPFRETGSASAALADWIHFARRLSERLTYWHSLEKNPEPTARDRLAGLARACEQWGVVASWRKVYYTCDQKINS